MKFPFKLALVLSLASALPSQAAQPLPDLSQLTVLLYKGNRADNAASVEAAQMQLQAGDPVAALNRVVQTVRRGDLAARALLVDWLAQRRLTLNAASAQAFVDEYQAAAAHGDAFGPLMLGLFSEYGFGPVPQDAAQAVTHYQQAAHNGNVWALVRLGLLYETGHAPQLAANLSTAAFWYGQAEGVDAQATAHIVAMYRSKTRWPGREPRTEADLVALEHVQREWNASHTINP